MTTSYDTLGDDSFGVSYDETTSNAAKFWQVEVAHYGPKTHAQASPPATALTDISAISQSAATAATQEYKSYLRLGTAPIPPATPPATPADASDGNDLADLVTSFFDDARWSNSDGAATNSMPGAQRVNESAILHKKGGWRSHTEGNRVDTTRGDKIEVVRGNYQMVVLGRQDAASNESRYEASGGHFSRDSNNMTPGALFEIKYHSHPTYGATWTTIEETTKGNHVSRFHGDVLEEYYGEKLDTYVGDASVGAIPSGTRASAASDAGNGDDRNKWLTASGDNKLNPVITERTYAKSLSVHEHFGTVAGTWGTVYKLTQGDGGTKEEWTGKYEEDWDAEDEAWTSDLRNITTYVESVEADSHTTTVTITNDLKETVRAKNITEESYASLKHASITGGLGAVTDTTLALGAFNGLRLSVGAMADFDICGVAKLGFSFAGAANIDIKMAIGAAIDILLANIKIDVYAAATVIETSAIELESGGLSLETKTLKLIA